MDICKYLRLRYEPRAVRHTVKLWIIVQAFSLSKAWMEDYKRAIAATTQKQKSTQAVKNQTK